MEGTIASTLGLADLDAPADVLVFARNAGLSRIGRRRN